MLSNEISLGAALERTCGLALSKILLSFIKKEKLQTSPLSCEGRCSFILSPALPGTALRDIGERDTIPTARTELSPMRDQPTYPPLPGGRTLH